MHRTSRGFAVAAAGALLALSAALAGCGAGADGSGAAGEARGAAADRADSGSAGGNGSGSGGAAPQQTGGAGSTSTTDLAQKAQSYIVRTATLTVEAKSVPDALTRARTEVTAAGGYIGDENTSLGDDGKESSQLQLRVPPEAYERLLDGFAGLGKLVDREVEAKDVTSDVVDVDSRVESQRASIARLRTLMDRATKLSDVVTLEGELSTREADLEALEAQQASLKARTAMATVTLNLRETDAAPAPKKDDGVWASALGALGAGWHAFYVTFRAIVVALAATLPFAVLGGAAWLAWRTIRRRSVRPAPASPDVSAEEA